MLAQIIMVYHWPILQEPAENVMINVQIQFHVIQQALESVHLRIEFLDMFLITQIIVFPVLQLPTLDAMFASMNLAK